MTRPGRPQQQAVCGCLPSVAALVVTIISFCGMFSAWHWHDAVLDRLDVGRLSDRVSARFEAVMLVKGQRAEEQRGDFLRNWEEMDLGLSQLSSSESDTVSIGLNKAAQHQQPKQHSEVKKGLDLDRLEQEVLEDDYEQGHHVSQKEPSSADLAGQVSKSLLAMNIYSPELLDMDAWQHVPERYQVNASQSGIRYFLYQPSGGWGNQKLILRWAILLANAMNRTLVLPPVAPHSSFYQNFNKFHANQTLHMGQVLDLDKLNSVVQAGIRVHVGDMESYQHNILDHLTWRRYERTNGIDFMNEQVIKKRWSKEKADVVFWTKASMWKCCSTPEIYYYHFIGYGLVFSRHLQAAAMRAARPLGARYNAIHFRRGDSGIRERRSIQKYANFHSFRMFRMDRQITLYIATDEHDSDFFQPFTRKSKGLGFKKLAFASDLDRTEVNRLVKAVPHEMRSTVLGIVDQILCNYAERWSGSAGSTFSFNIAAMRNQRKEKSDYFTKNSKHKDFFPR